MGKNLCSGMGTRFRTHMRWVRICVRFSGNKFPANLKFIVEDLAFTVPVWVESTVGWRKVAGKLERFAGNRD